MPTKIYSSSEALHNLNTNTAAKWPMRGDVENRIEPIAKPVFKASFKFTPGASIFTIGSCFARNIETALVNRGFNIPTREHWDKYFAHFDLNNNIMNNYGVSSICNELRWALEEGTYNPETQIAEIFPGRFRDLNFPSHVALDSYETVLSRRQSIFEVTRNILTCEAMVLTLGLAEVWWDNRSEFYLNVKPPSALMVAEPDRFELHVLDYNEVLGELRKISQLLHKHCPNIRVIISVSPVPLLATFTEQDVCVANTYSKSVLRTAVSAICAEDNRFDYFPSYESLVLSDRQKAWGTDLIHPTLELIDVNVGRMIEHYVGVNVERKSAIRPQKHVTYGTSIGENVVLNRAAEFIQNEKYEEAISTIGNLEEVHNIRRAAYLVGRSYMGLAKPEAALEAFEAGVRKAPRDPSCNMGLGHACEALGRKNDALEHFKRVLDLSPDHVGAMASIAKLYISMGDLSSAQPLLQLAKSLRPDFPQVDKISALYDRAVAKKASEVRKAVPLLKVV